MREGYITFLRKKEEEMVNIYKSALVQLKKEKVHQNHTDAIKIILKGHEKILKELTDQELVDAI